MDICVKTGDPGVAYAAAELGRCGRAMTDSTTASGDAASRTVTLGLFGECARRTHEPLAEHADPGLSRPLSRHHSE